MITAQTARELARIPTEIKIIDKKIRKAAIKGEPSILISGELNWELDKKLRDEFDFEISYDSNSKQTHIWWGN